jgi:hypothetical protein
MDNIYDLNTTAHRNPLSGLLDGSHDLDLVPLYKEPSAEKSVTEMEAIRQATLLTQQAIQMQAQSIQQLAAQNAETNKLVAQIASRPPVAPPAPPAGTSGNGTAATNPSGSTGIDWAAMMSGGGHTAPPAQTAAAPPPPAPDPREIAKQVYREREDEYARLQQQTNLYYQHFQQNFPELHPHFAMVKDRFGLEVAAGRDMATAYTNAVAYGRQMLPSLRQPAAPQPTPGGYGDGGQWMPGVSPAQNKETVVDMAGQKYPVERYVGGVVPLVAYTDAQEERHTQRYADFRNDLNQVRRGKLHSDAMKEYPERLAAV